MEQRRRAAQIETFAPGQPDHPTHDRGGARDHQVDRVSHGGRDLLGCRQAGQVDFVWPRAEGKDPIGEAVVDDEGVVVRDVEQGRLRHHNP